MSEADAFALLGLDDPDVFAACQALDLFAERLRTGKTTRMLVAAACALLQEKRVRIKGRSAFHEKHLQDLCLGYARALAVASPGDKKHRDYMLKRVRMTYPKKIMQLPGAGDEIRIFIDHDTKPDVYQDIFDGYAKHWPGIMPFTPSFNIGTDWRKL